MTAPIFRLHEGGSRLVLSIPHAGTYLPDHIRPHLTPVGLSVCDTDWHVDQLYDFAAAEDVTVLVATHSRTVVDLNRSPAGGALYPGQAETTICPTESFDGAPLYTAAPPDAAEIADRVTRYWQPYHDALSAQLDRVKLLHGEVLLLDGHSIRSQVPRLFAGTLPDLNFGTNGGAAAGPELAARAMHAAAGSGFSQVLNGRFRGGYITRHYGRPESGVQAVQLELATSTYLDETDPQHFDANRAAALVAVLRGIVRKLRDA